MFSQSVVPELEKNRKLAQNLFDELESSSKFAAEANDFFEMGSTYIKESKNLTQLELDKIVVGTLLLAFRRHDFKYMASKSVAKHVDEKMKEAISGLGLGLQGGVLNPSKMYQIEHVLLVGKKILEEKAIPFNGIFSQVKETQEMIETQLPYMSGDYLKTTYDFKFGPVKTV